MAGVLEHLHDAPGHGLVALGVCHVALSSLEVLGGVRGPDSAHVRLAVAELACLVTPHAPPLEGDAVEVFEHTLGELGANLAELTTGLLGGGRVALPDPRLQDDLHLLHALACLVFEVVPNLAHRGLVLANHPARGGQSLEILHRGVREGHDTVPKGAALLAAWQSELGRCWRLAQHGIELHGEGDTLVYGFLDDRRAVDRPHDAPILLSAVATAALGLGGPRTLAHGLASNLHCCGPRRGLIGPLVAAALAHRGA